MSELSLFECGLQAKALIEKCVKYSERLTGVFFRKNFGESMLDESGCLTEFAEACFAYFNELKSHHESPSQRDEQKFKQYQTSLKIENASIKRSRNIERARFIGSLRYKVTNNDQLRITTDSRSVASIPTQIRRYFRSLGICYLGKSLKNGIQFSGDAVKAILTLLSQRQQSAPFSHIESEHLMSVLSLVLTSADLEHPKVSTLGVEGY